MKEITILSGKGGAGKTSVTAAIASLVNNAVFCDNDVDAADLHLVFNPKIKEEHDFSSGKKAVIDAKKCSACGLCIEKCRFDAIHVNDEGIPEINHFQCEGCRLCERICPEQAITSVQYNNNKWFVSDTRFGLLVHARMKAGEENSGRLVTEIRGKARQIAEESAADFVINDGPPGIGCPVIASVTGTDKVLLVTEPSLSGLHDAGRLLKLVESFRIPVFAVINKYDINPEITAQTARFFEEKAIPLIGKIPFDTRLVDAMVAGKSVVEFAPGTELATEFVTICEKLGIFQDIRNE
ncbi:MinD superfamily P-loop ATPase, contains an inserted ferredoxin domain [Mariniphaga anaerophila]|uniref:MinD superfamily P-loop ATPase, contains an inserted ferredoxin domain n=1 Tax=Mariniphaga anaerophila TaxID=1484053 RepID=A0A1M4Y626_9BACT|nr:ATP-binding protein [Mariniphaga anaerophila]SHF01264.1 MinD superfamily P-loop ATPase, contains an inserted ferredoxin domain [Mariniphaga anaerophila]